MSRLDMLFLAIAGGTPLEATTYQHSRRRFPPGPCRYSASLCRGWSRPGSEDPDCDNMVLSMDFPLLTGREAARLCGI